MQAKKRQTTKKTAKKATGTAKKTKKKTKKKGKAAAREARTHSPGAGRGTRDAAGAKGSRKQAKKPASRKSAAKGRAKQKSAGRAAPARRPGNRPPFPIELRGAEILLRLEDLLHERILGKDDAVERIAMALRVRMTNLDFRPERPNGSFLLVGPPGVGKNEFAYALAGILYGDESAVAPIDMRAISTEEDSSRLTDTIITGPQPILLEGMLTTPVRRRPHTILLLQGIEHAHPVAHRLVQQIISHGAIDDAQGRVSFEHTILFATCRLPEDETGPASQIGFNRIPTSYDQRIVEKLRHRLGEEFIEAFEEVLVVPPLTPEDVRRIARYKIEVVLGRLQKEKRGVEVSEKVFRVFITDKDAEQAGAGMLNRTLEKQLLNPLARYLLSNPDERKIKVGIRRGALYIEPDRVGRGRRSRAAAKS